MPVLGGFQAGNYRTERLWATAPDGVKVPISLVYRKDLLKRDGSNPLLLDGCARCMVCDRVGPCAWQVF
jgi:oligopeptidase B